ncbi:MAG: dihydrodipicolinate synthase family protein, partial [Schleiferiaceae bacterium]|nr:dihydrodipicolinate synthase family protein [Schleiferiaceae bacterium]
MRANIGGTGIALVTPFNADKSVDFEGLKKLVNHCILGGVDYLVSMGTTGESATLNAQEKNQVTQTIIEATDGRVPVVLGIGGNDTQSIIDSIQSANLEGIEAILSVSPYYNKPTQEGIYQHYKALAEVSPKPIIVY